MGGASTTLREFLAGSVAQIPGWLHDEAALLSGALFESQRERGVGGPVLEIGTFKGKYLSVLYRLAEPHPVVGLDLFVGSSNTREDAEAVKRNVASACGDSARLSIIAVDSTRITARELGARTGVDRFAFVSVDGGHSREVVMNDVALASEVLADGGIIALDDAFNHTTPGVIEGISAFFHQERPALAPFAHCYNKLFVTTTSHHAACLRETWRFVEEATWLPTHERTLHWRRESESVKFRPMMFGFEIVPFL